MSDGKLPDFLLIGATKCGTTSLVRWLAGHPGIFMAANKELRYFTREHNFHKGPEWYAAQFRDAPAGSVIGEASNAYTRHPVYDGVPGRIAAALPDVKLVYVTREPMRRIKSHWRHRLVTGIEWRAPTRAIRADSRYLAASLYGHQIEQYRKHFPPEQILVLRSEDLFAAPGVELERLSSFLGVDPEQAPGFSSSNVTSDRLIAPRPLRRLGGIPRIKPHAKRLAALLSASPARRFLKTADQASFTLDPELRVELSRALATDRAKMADLIGAHSTYAPADAGASAA